MTTKHETTGWVRLYLSGPIDIAKQLLRQECLARGLCVTVEPTAFIYTGGEEAGYVVGIINYPKFPSSQDAIYQLGQELALTLMRGTFQQSALVMTPTITTWMTTRT